MIVLAHGWTERLTFWGPVIGRLVDAGLRPVAYDLRGHGESAPAADGDYSLERFGDDVEAVLVAALADGERGLVAGHSLGGMSITAWAGAHDAAVRVHAAALVNTAMGDLLTGHLLLGELAKRLEHPAVSRLVMGSGLRVPPFSTPLQQAIIRHAAFGPTATPGMVAFYERMLIQSDAAARAAAGLALTDMDLWQALARLGVPTLVIAGDRDRLTPPAQARRIADGLPQLAGSGRARGDRSHGAAGASGAGRRRAGAAVRRPRPSPRLRGAVSRARWPRAFAPAVAPSSALSGCASGAWRVPPRWSPAPARARGGGCSTLCGRSCRLRWPHRSPG